MTCWENLGAGHEVLRFWTSIGLEWATKYYKQMDGTDVYVITMCKFYPRRVTALIASSKPQNLVLDPSVRFSWIEKKWEKPDIRDSKKKILDLVSTINHLIAYHRHTSISRRCISTVRIPPHPSKFRVPIMIPLSPAVKVEIFPRDLNSKISYMKVNPHPRSSRSKQNTRSMHQAVVPLLRRTS